MICIVCLFLEINLNVVYLRINVRNSNWIKLIYNIVYKIKQDGLKPIARISSNTPTYIPQRDAASLNIQILFMLRHIPLGPLTLSLLHLHDP